MQAYMSALGVMAGVSGLVLVVALGGGADREIQTSLGALGTGAIVIQSKHTEKSTERDSGLTLGRVKTLELMLSGRLVGYTAVSRSQMSVFAGGQPSKSVNVIATDQRYLSMFGLDLAEGRFLTDFDLQQAQKVVVVGWDMARYLFPQKNAVGQSLKIGDIWYRVVGVLNPDLYQEEDTSFNYTNSRMTVYVPVVQRRTGYDRTPAGQFILKFADEKLMLSALGIVSRFFQLDTKDPALEVIVPVDLLRQKQKTRYIIQYLLTAVATLILAVGGVGIMNMMMLNVASRKPEIGLRRAIGANRFDITAQFLAESLVVSLTGGVIGILVGLASTIVIDYYSSWTMVFNSSVAFMGFILSLLVGVGFGIYPALNAARVSPVESLRAT